MRVLQLVCEVFHMCVCCSLSLLCVQVMCVASSGKHISNLIYGQSWDETATDQVACCSAAGEVHVRVMTFHTGTMRAVYAIAHLTAGFNKRDGFMFSMCDENYNVQQPLLEWLVRTRVFQQRSGYADSSVALYYQFVFLTQRLQLPCGYVLPPGTSLHQVR